MYTDIHYRKIRTKKYDPKLISKIKKTFKGLKPNQISIFFDMDNTLFIYSKDSNDELSLELQKNRGFFENLEPYKEGPEVLKKLMDLGYNVFILSACMNNDYCKLEKRKSLEKHFPFLKDEQIIFTLNGENKAEKIKEKGIRIAGRSVLVDDYCVNLFNWMDEGGLAIKKTFSGKKRNIPQVHNFNEMYDILEGIL